MPSEFQPLTSADALRSLQGVQPVGPSNKTDQELTAEFQEKRDEAAARTAQEIRVVKPGSNGVSVTQQVTTATSNGTRNGSTFETTGGGSRTDVTAPITPNLSVNVDYREVYNSTTITSPTGEKTTTTSGGEETGIGATYSLTKKGANPNANVNLRYGEVQPLDGSKTETVRAQATVNGTIPLGPDTNLYGSVQGRVTQDLTNDQTTGRVTATGGLTQRVGDLTIDGSVFYRQQKNFTTGVGGDGLAAQLRITTKIGDNTTITGYGGVQQGGLNLDPTDGIVPAINSDGQPSATSTVFGIQIQTKF